MFSAISIAWGNTFQNWKRTLAALAGITFSILLVFVQLGFLNGAKTAVTLIFDSFAFDIAITSDKYQIMPTADPFDRIRLVQARIDPGVLDSFKFNVRTGSWFDEKTELESTVLLIGIDDKPSFMVNSDFIDGLESVTDGQSVFLDRLSHKDFGEIKIGLGGQINSRAVTVTQLFDLGLFFYAEGAAATVNGNFVKLSGQTSDDVTVGFLKIRDGFSVDKTVARLQKTLPNDVVISSRDKFIERERNYFIEVKPVGILFKSAVFIAFAVGFVILFQVLSTELGNRISEFATLKAMGFSTKFIYGIGIAQNLIITIFSFLPASLLCTLVFEIIYAVSKLPVSMTLELFTTVFGLTMLMSVFAGLLALKKLSKADPAELF
jgi:putative ABC transport system permease protein